MNERCQVEADFSHLGGLPRDESGPVFRAPWEAQAFAMVQLLLEKGLFKRAEWAAALGAEICKAQAAGDRDLGDTYYLHWLAALEDLVCRKGLSSESDLLLYKSAWQKAARRIPHGQPIHLSGEDFL